MMWTLFFRACGVCGKVLSDLWKHMRTVHGQYRRKLKIPKEEVFGQSLPPPLPFDVKLPLPPSLPETEIETIPVAASPTKPVKSQKSPNKVKLPPSEKEIQTTAAAGSPTKPVKSQKSPNKRKTSTPLKVKLPFKMAYKEKE